MVREERAYAGLEAASRQRGGPTLGYRLACPRTERTVCLHTESEGDESQQRRSFERQVGAKGLVIFKWQ